MMNKPTLSFLLMVPLTIGWPADGGAMTVSDWRTLCGQDRNACQIYLRGVLDGAVELEAQHRARFDIAPAICIPTQTTDADLADSLLSALATRPDAGDKPLANLAISHFDARYPCARSSSPILRDYAPPRPKSQ